MPSLNQCNRREGTIKQRVFVRSLFDINNPRTFGNLTQSARKARYKGSDGVLANVGWQNVRKLQVIKMAESLVNSILSTDGVEQEITSIATTKTEVDGAMRMKALDLLTKIKGMQVQRVETVDVNERDGFALTLYTHITDAVRVRVGATEWAMMTDSERERLEGEGAIALHATMARTNHPTLAAASAWGKWQGVIEANLAAQAVVAEPVITEIGDQ